MSGFEDFGLRGGVWRGQVTRQTAPGRILLVHMGEVLDRAEVAPQGDGVWQVSVRLPSDRLTDGAATFALHEDTASGNEALQAGSTILATLPLIAGKALHRDLRTELTLLRAELDLLKREFRRHAAEAANGGWAQKMAEAATAPAGEPSPLDGAPQQRSDDPDDAVVPAAAAAFDTAPPDNV